MQGCAAPAKHPTNAYDRKPKTHCHRPSSVAQHRRCCTLLLYSSRNRFPEGFETSSDAKIPSREPLYAEAAVGVSVTW
jgi:hypothetical protein